MKGFDFMQNRFKGSVVMAINNNISEVKAPEPAKPEEKKVEAEVDESDGEYKREVELAEDFYSMAFLSYKKDVIKEYKVTKAA